MRAVSALGVVHGHIQRNGGSESTDRGVVGIFCRLIGFPVLFQVRAVLQSEIQIVFNAFEHFAVRRGHGGKFHGIGDDPLRETQQLSQCQFCGGGGIFRRVAGAFSGIVIDFEVECIGEGGGTGFKLEFRFFQQGVVELHVRFGDPDLGVGKHHFVVRVSHSAEQQTACVLLGGFRPAQIVLGGEDAHLTLKTVKHHQRGGNARLGRETAPAGARIRILTPVVIAAQGVGEIHRGHVGGERFFVLRIGGFNGITHALEGRIVLQGDLPGIVQRESLDPLRQGLVFFFFDLGKSSAGNGERRFFGQTPRQQQTGGRCSEKATSIFHHSGTPYLFGYVKIFYDSENKFI